MNFDLSTFQDRLRYARVRKGMSQLALGRQLSHKHSSQICLWEKGKVIPQNVPALADVLGVRVDWLLLGTGEMEVPHAAR